MNSISTFLIGLYNPQTVSALSDPQVRARIKYLLDITDGSLINGVTDTADINLSVTGTSISALFTSRNISQFTNDIGYVVYNTATITTTDATITTIVTIPIPTTTTVLIEANVVARRTGGISGTAEDGAGYRVMAVYKNVAGTATEIGETSIFSAEDQSAWSCSVSASSGNALIQVTGATGNNISWSVTYKTYTV